MWFFCIIVCFNRSTKIAYHSKSKIVSIEEIKKQIGKKRIEKHKLLNETFWWVSIAKKSLDNSLKENNYSSGIKIHVPSKISQTRQISRTPEQVKNIIQRAQSIDLYYSIYVSIVAQVEDFFSFLVYSILKADSRRIKGSASGVETLKKIDIEEVIDALDKDEIIEKIIRKNIITIFYASPQRQKDYFEKVLGVKIDDCYWDDWFEIKATRDIIVHNSGIVNELYIEKSKANAKWKLGETVIINENLFGETVANLKSIIGKLELTARKSLK